MAEACCGGSDSHQKKLCITNISPVTTQAALVIITTVSLKWRCSIAVAYRPPRDTIQSLMPVLLCGSFRCRP